MTCQDAPDKTETSVRYLAKQAKMAFLTTGKIHFKLVPQL